MKIVSLNIWDLPVGFVRDRKERHARIRDFFHELNPDIICLQESFDPEHRMKLNDFFGEKGYFTSDKDIAVRNVLGRKMDTTGGLVTYARFPLLSTAFVAFKRPKFSPIEYVARKGLLATLLATPFGTVQVVNTHLARVMCGEGTRRRQIKIIMDFIKTHEVIPTLLAGDFNQHDLFKNPVFEDIISSEHFVHSDQTNDAHTYRKENKYVDIWMNRIARSQRLDYIFSANLHTVGLCVRTYDVLYPHEPLSDHDPVLLTFYPVP